MRNMILHEAHRLSLKRSNFKPWTMKQAVKQKYKNNITKITGSIQLYVFKWNKCEEYVSNFYFTHLFKQYKSSMEVCLYRSCRMACRVLVFILGMLTSLMKSPAISWLRNWEWYAKITLWAYKTKLKLQQNTHTEQITGQSLQWFFPFLFWLFLFLTLLFGFTQKPNNRVLEDYVMSYQKSSHKNWQIVHTDIISNCICVK